MPCVMQVNTTALLYMLVYSVKAVSSKSSLTDNSIILLAMAIALTPFNLSFSLFNDFYHERQSLWLVQVLKHAFTYHWKVWTIAEALELLHEAGFEEVHVWMRCMIVSFLADKTL